MKMLSGRTNWMVVAGVALGLAYGSVAWAQQNQGQANRTAAQQAAMAQAAQAEQANVPTAGVDPSGLDGTGSIEAQQARMRNDDRQKQLVDDTAKLLSLANELKVDVDKSSKDTLSLDVVRKADEIEKLAREVRDKMKGS